MEFRGITRVRVPELRQHCRNAGSLRQRDLSILAMPAEWQAAFFIKVSGQRLDMARTLAAFGWNL